MAPFDLALGYLVFDVSRLPAWQRFCSGVLGLPAPLAHDDGSLGWQVDGACQRLITRSGTADDIAALGLECADDSALEAVLARLRQHRHPVAEGSAGLREARRVQRLHVVHDPDGNMVELFTGLAAAERPFASGAFPSGFCTGPGLGLGHAALVSRDPGRLESFYVETLGFGVTERLATRGGPLEVHGSFLHCNRRHHSLALFDLPLARRMHHFMLQAPHLHDVGLAHERARRHKVPISLSLGQHPAPDATFSFYGATPSGFDFEIGAGAHEIDPAGWQVQHTKTSSSWGHRPTLRLQLQMAAGLVRRRAGALRLGSVKAG